MDGLSFLAGLVVIAVTFVVSSKIAPMGGRRVKEPRTMLYFLLVHWIGISTVLIIVGVAWQGVIPGVLLALVMVYYFHVRGLRRIANSARK